MRLAVILGALAASAIAAYAQGVETLEEKLARKLKSPFLGKADWKTDYEKALAASKEENKIIFAYFTRSCVKDQPCEMVEAGALCEEKFVEWSKDWVLFCHITTQVDKAPHDNLHKEKGGDRWPFFLFLDSEGKTLGRHLGIWHPDAFKRTGEKVKTVVELRKKCAEGGDAAAKVELFALEAELAHFKLEAAEKVVAKHFTDVAPELRKKVDETLVNVEVQETLLGIKDSLGLDAGKKFVSMKKDGRIPTTYNEGLGFWWRIVAYAEVTKDVRNFEEALVVLEKKYSDVPNAARSLGQKRAILEKMKEAGGDHKEHGDK